MRRGPRSGPARGALTIGAAAGGLTRLLLKNTNYPKPTTKKRKGSIPMPFWGFEGPKRARDSLGRLDYYRLILDYW